MGGYSSNPPTFESPGTPNIPVPNYTEQGQQTATGYQAAGWWNDFWLKHTAHIVPGVVAILTFVASVVDTMITPLVQIFSAIQGTNTPGAASLAAATIEDLLGVPVNASAIQAAFGHGQQAGVTALGAAVLGQLIKEMSPAGATTLPLDGLNAAEAFLGFGLQFAIREGNIDFITSLIPEEWRVGEGLRGYGVGMAQALGLGRLARLVFAPVMKALVQDPLTWYFNQQYTPTLLGPASAIKAFNRGLLDAGTFTTEMAYAGYTAQRVAALQAEQLTQLSPADLYTQHIHADPNLSNFQLGLQNLGYSPQDSANLVNILTWNDADTFLQQMATTAYTKALSDPKQAAAFAQYVLNLWPGGNKGQFWAQRLADDLATPRKFLTWADVESAVVKGILAIDDAATFLQNQGYGPTDLNTLMLLMLDKLSEDVAKDARTKYTYALAVAKAQAAGTAIPPPPPLSEGGTA